mgnify:FL=1
MVNKFILCLFALNCGLFAEPLDPRFHSFNEIKSFLDSLDQLEQYEDIFRVDTIGYSGAETLPILAVKISDNVHIKEDEPRVLFLGQCHAEEILGVEAVLEMILTLLSPPPPMASHVQILRQEIETWIIPTYNPEGLNVVHSEMDLSYRKNKRDVSPTGPTPNGVFDFDPSIGNDVDGVDLNRNYDFNWFFGDSFLVNDPTDYAAHYDYYRGPEPFSEQETKAIRDFALEQDFLFSIAWHSARSGRYSELVISSWKWAEGKNTPDNNAQNTIADALAGNLQKEYSEDFYQSEQSVSRRGNAHDWFYTATGCFQYLVEGGTANLQPDSALIEDTIQRLIPGMVYLMDRTIGYQEDAAQITGIVTDELGNPFEDVEIIINELNGGVNDPRLTDEFGRYRRIVTEGTYQLTAQKYGYEPVTNTITANNSGTTILDFSLDPLTEVNINLSIGFYQQLWHDEHFSWIMTNDFFTDTIIVDDGSNTFAMPKGNWDIQTVYDDSYFPWIRNLELDSDMEINVSFRQNVIDTVLGFGDSTMWNQIGGDWTIDSGSLRSQVGSFYNNGNREDTLEIRSRWFDMTGMQQIACVINHRYELEWDVDSLFLTLVNGQDSVLTEWSATDQNWHAFRTDRIVARDTSGFDSVRVRLRFSRDASVNYRGWEIASLRILGLDDPYLNVTDSGPQIRSSFSVSDPYPNPSSGMISIDMEHIQFPLQVTIFNLLGQEIFNQSLNQGFREQITWQLNLFNQMDVPISSGVYFLRFSTSHKEFIKKCVYLRP